MSTVVLVLEDDLASAGSGDGTTPRAVASQVPKCDFYVLDERGRPTDYKNLAELRARLAPVMLRRRKDEVEDQLPGRTVDTFYEQMTEEQKKRYADYETPAARLIQVAQRRPVRKAEFDRLQQLLACMRMICDTPYILDPSCRDCPKLEELENILGELLAEPGRKIIIFSEWQRMLELVRELAQEMGAEFAWHTGLVPRDRRRAEIRRCKNDPACRLFLSLATDLVERLSGKLVLLERHRTASGGETLLVVMDGTDAEIAAERDRLGDAAGVEFISRSAWEAMCRLQSAQLLKLEAGESLHPAAASRTEPDAKQMRNRRAADDWLKQAERRLRTANLLADGGFAGEAVPPLAEAAWLAIRSVAIAADVGLEPGQVAALPEAELTELHG
jgi:hypothetical protein